MNNRPQEFCLLSCIFLNQCSTSNSNYLVDNIELKLNEKYSDADWQVANNTKEHHTNEYVRSDNALVLRRGQTFKVRFCN